MNLSLLINAKMTTIVRLHNHLSMAMHRAHCKDSDQTTWMRSLIWGFITHIYSHHDFSSENLVQIARMHMLSRMFVARVREMIHKMTNSPLFHNVASDGPDQPNCANWPVWSFIECRIIECCGIYWQSKKLWSDWMDEQVNPELCFSL